MKAVPGMPDMPPNPAGKDLPDFIIAKTASWFRMKDEILLATDETRKEGHAGRSHGNPCFIGGAGLKTVYFVLKFDHPPCGAMEMLSRAWHFHRPKGGKLSCILIFCPVTFLSKDFFEPWTSLPTTYH